MSDTDSGQETWEPRRGPVFKVAAWVLLALIAITLGSILLWTLISMLFETRTVLE